MRYISRKLMLTLKWTQLTALNAEYLSDCWNWNRWLGYNKNTIFVALPSVGSVTQYSYGVGLWLG